VVTPEPFPTGRWARLHVATPEPFHTRKRVWSHGSRGDTEANPCRVAGLVAHGDARALLHRECVSSHGRRCDTRALPCWVACPTPRGTWWCQSSPALVAGLEPRGHVATREPFPTGCEVWHCRTRHKSCAWGYPVCRVLTRVTAAEKRAPDTIHSTSAD
jgi:hypothetical protein